MPDQSIYDDVVRQGLRTSANLMQSAMQQEESEEKTQKLFELSSDIVGKIMPAFEAGMDKNKALELVQRRGQELGIDSMTAIDTFRTIWKTGDEMSKKAGVPDINKILSAYNTKLGIQAKLRAADPASQARKAEFKRAEKAIDPYRAALNRIKSVIQPGMDQDELNEAIQGELQNLYFQNPELEAYDEDLKVGIAQIVRNPNIDIDLIAKERFVTPFTGRSSGSSRDKFDDIVDTAVQKTIARR